MTGRIVVGSDGSRQSGNALDWAVARARLGGEQLELVNATEAILGHADDAQLIVVGTLGKGLVRRVLLGSVSRQLLNDADRPVAIVDLPEG